jgi:predicted enzyme related to lactoylglutathione lyase
MNILRRDVGPIRLSQSLAILLAIAAVGRAAAGPLDLPAVQSVATTEHHVGKVIWVELVTPGLATAESFYGGLFGWTFEARHVGSSDYAVAAANGQRIGGIVEHHLKPGDRKQSSWLTFLSVKNVDATREAVDRDGGKVISPPTTYAGRGRQAVFSDPDGAVFAVLDSSSGDPGDYLAEPGEWIWSSLLAKNPDGAAKFYQEVFGYDVFDLPSDDGAEHVVLSNEDYARAGVNPLPQDAMHRRSHWLNFVRVEDAVEMARKAVTLGGRVLVEPHLDRHGGKVALLADPAGAPFGVLEWTAADSKVEPQ